MRILVSISFLLGVWMNVAMRAEETSPDQIREVGARRTPRPVKQTFNGEKIKDKTITAAKINSTPASAGMVLAADGMGGAAFISEVAGNIEDKTITAAKINSASASAGMVLAADGNGGAAFISEVAGNVSTFTGPLAGDVIGTQSATVIAPGAVTAAKLDPGIGLWVATETGVSRPNGRVIVQGSSIDTTNFTGLSLQYSTVTNEGAIMSAFDDGLSSLSFYTKAGIGLPVTQRMIINGSGNVGVGTSAPQSKLEVRGNIALGLNGEYRAPAGEENLRIVRGVVGGGGGLLVGAGFTVTKGAAGSGQYTIIFNTPFTGAPAVTATADLDGRVISTVGVTSSGANFQISVTTGGHTDAAFHVIAIGPR